MRLPTNEKIYKFPERKSCAYYEWSPRIAPVYILFKNPFKGVLTLNKGYICDTPFVTLIGDIQNQAMHTVVHVLSKQEKWEDLQKAINTAENYEYTMRRKLKPQSFWSPNSRTNVKTIRVVSEIVKSGPHELSRQHALYTW